MGITPVVPIIMGLNNLQKGGDIMMSQVYISLDCITYDLYDVLQIVSNDTWLVQLSGTIHKYWLMPNVTPLQYQPYVLEDFNTHEIRYVYVKPTH
jgi:hypothetical protein